MIDAMMPNGWSYQDLMEDTPFIPPCCGECEECVACVTGHISEPYKECKMDEKEEKLLIA